MRTLILILSLTVCPPPLSAGGALEQLALFSPADLPAVPPPDPAWTAIQDGGAEKSVGTVTSREAIKLAKENMDRAILRRAEYPKAGFWAQAEALRAAFDNRFDFRNADCGGGRAGFAMFTKKAEYYLSQSSSRKKNIIHVCRGYVPDPELMAQDLIHEVSHLALNTFEHQATELEMVLTKLGGSWPVINGYVSYNEGLTQEDMAWLGYEYLDFALGINSELSYRFQILRANIVYDNFGAFERNLAKAEDQFQELLAFRDGRGFGLRDIAARRGRHEFTAYLKKLEQEASIR